MWLQCPIDYYYENLIFGSDKSCWAVYAINGFDYDLLGDGAKIQLLQKLIRYIVGIYSECKVLVIPVSQGIEEHFNKLDGLMDEIDPLCNFARSYSTQVKEYLYRKVEASGQINDYQTFVCVKLKSNENGEILTGIKDTVDYLIKEPINAINVFMGTDKRDILKSKLEQFEHMAKRFFEEQNDYIAMEPVKGDIMQWLLRRMMYRGINEPVKLFSSGDDNRPWIPKAEELKIDKETTYRPNSRDIVNLFSGVMERKHRRLEVAHDGGATSYQTFLVLTGIPDVIEFPGNEYIYMLQRLNTQAEICIHMKTIPYRAGLEKLEKKKTEINSHAEYIAGSKSNIPGELLEGREYAEYLEDELRKGRYPMVMTTVSFCVAADSLEEMELKASRVRREYEDRNFIVERPLTDQLKLFFQFVPTTGFCIKDFVMTLTPMALAGGIIGATRQLGDKEGGYIGTTGRERKNVFLALWEACMKNFSAVATFFGNLGVGKSYNANLLLLIHVLYGAYALIFDPKSERTHWVTDMPFLKGHISLVTISTEDEYVGRLDPFNIYRENMNDACDLARNVLIELFDIKPQSDKDDALLEALGKIKNEKRPSMMKLAEVLDNFDDDDGLCEVAKGLSRSIKLRRNNSNAKLLIGDGTEQAITLTNRINILQIDGLTFPERGTPRDQLTVEEKDSAILMMVMANFAQRFMFSKALRNMFKIILFDESYILGQTGEGEKLFTKLTRMSRSLFTSIILNGHSVEDIPNESIKNSVTYKFCFQTGNRNEAERMLNYMNLEVTPRNIELIQNLNNGQCLFQDLNRRVGVLQFDVVFDDIDKIFNTTPVDARANKANKAAKHTEAEIDEFEINKKSEMAVAVDPEMNKNPKAAEAIKPATNIEPKAAETIKPATNRKSKAVETTEPVTNKKPKAAETAKPATNKKPKAAETAKPATNRKPKADETVKPATNRKPKAAETAKPATSRKKKADNTVPTEEVKPDAEELQVENAHRERVFQMPGILKPARIGMPVELMQGTTKLKPVSLMSVSHKERDDAV